MLDKAIELDPKYAHAHAWKACVLGQGWVHGWCEDAEVALQGRSQEELQIALALDDNDADVHRILAALQPELQQPRQGGLSPGAGAEPQSEQRSHRRAAGRGADLARAAAKKGIEWIRKAMRLNPYHPERFWSHLGRAQYTAQALCRRDPVLQPHLTPDHTHHAFMAASSAQMGNATAAAAHAREVLRASPPSPSRRISPRCTTSRTPTASIAARGS